MRIRTATAMRTALATVAAVGTLGVMAGTSEAAAPAPSPVYIGVTNGVLGVLDTGTNALNLDAHYYWSQLPVVESSMPLTNVGGCTIHPKAGGARPYKATCATGTAGLNIIANAGNDTVKAHHWIGSLTVNGGAGNDTISTTAGAQLPTVFGGDNDDTLTISGGTADGQGGSDKLVGSSGPDTLIGGTGVDTFDAKGGADTIKAKDGIKDGAIKCGEGRDTVEADAVDVLPAGCMP